MNEFRRTLSHYVKAFHRTVSNYGDVSRCVEVRLTTVSHYVNVFLGGFRVKSKSSTDYGHDILKV